MRGLLCLLKRLRDSRLHASMVSNMQRCDRKSTYMDHAKACLLTALRVNTFCKSDFPVVYAG